jgi:hypothetical protein
VGVQGGGGAGDGLGEQLYPQYDAAHPLGVPLLVNVLASVAQAGYVVEAAPAFNEIVGAFAERAP